MSDDKKCTYILDSGQRCGSWALKDKNYCFSHDPDSLEKKILAVTKGGLTRSVKVDVPMEVMPIATPGDVASLLASTINDVRAGNLDLRVANTVGYLAGVLIKALEVAEVDRKIEAVRAILLGRETNSKERSGR